MRRSWLGVREPAVAEGFGIPAEAQMPVPVETRASQLDRPSSPARSWWSFGVRLVRNAVIAALAMTLVPLAVVAVRGDHVATALYSSNANTRARVMMIGEPLRTFGVARDASITPLQAGSALNALQYRRSTSTAFVAIHPATRPVRPWRTNVIAPDMFVTARPTLYEGPSSQSILEAAVKGFSPREEAYLRELAESPIWRDFDLVARAPEVDVVGGQLQLPFAADVLPEMRPLPSFRDSKELAYAAVSRAAYYMSVGQPREAEQVLRSIVSFGFTFIDDGTTTLDELIGTVIIGIGRDALQRFYVLEHDPRAALPELAAPAVGTSVRSSTRAAAKLSPEEVRRLLVAELAEPAVPRPQRFEAIRQLTLMQCTSARGLLFGQRDDVTEAIARARHELARYPSERALVDLETRLPSLQRFGMTSGPLQPLLVSPAIVAGVVLHNPRMAACTLLLTSGQ